MKYTLITLAALSGTAFAQTITNGNFSDTSGMDVDTSPGGTVFNGVPAGWASSNGIVQVLDYNAFGNPSGFSSNYIDTYDTLQAVTLSQAVNGFTPGQQYTLSYDWGNWSTTPYDMTISMGNGLASHTGTGTETLSVAFNHTNGDSGSGFNTTNFTVTPVNPVPEPSSAALLGLGGLALILRRRK